MARDHSSQRTPRSRDRTKDRRRTSESRGDRGRDRDRTRERAQEPDSDREREREARREARRQRRQSSSHPPRRERGAGGTDDERRERRERHRSRQPSNSRDGRRRSRATSGAAAAAGAAAGLSAAATAQRERDRRREEKRQREEEQARIEQEQRRHARRQARRAQGQVPREEYVEISAGKPPREKKGLKRRVVSGAVMEEGRAKKYSALRGGAGTDEYVEKDLYQPKRPWWKRRRIWMYIAGGVVALIVIIVVAVVVSKKNSDDEPSDGPSTSNLDSIDRDSIPQEYRNTELDPWTWADTSGFNLTFTTETVGDLPVMGLFTDWDDSKAPNDKVPAIEKSWGSYGDRPARGVNVGGWLNLEPFITPSLFDYDSKLGIVDEWTLCEHLGSQARDKMEEHYASFITESTFRDIADAGLDHVRIPFNYWAVEKYDDEPYVERVSWRYLLRAIEWARKYGLRVNLDVHGLPGSQNGWNHSGRLGAIGWFNGTDGEKNAKRSLEMHDRLSKFFAQDRYKNIISFYGLANEPKMTKLDSADVVSWTQEVFDMVRDNGIDAVVVFGDGFMGLKKWQGLLTGNDGLALDVHQYLIFNKGQITYTHKKKVEFACDGWSKQTEESMDTSTGFGPTVFAEWSQADTDCARHVTNVGWGNRWEGTYDAHGTDEDALEPRCPTEDDQCSCKQANADSGDYSDDYKKFLKMFAEAQMHSFEKGWGWWYWTWKTEDAVQWSYELGLKAGILPEKAYDRDFDCDSDVPDFGDLPEYY